jgi:hypothetical protein
MTTPQTRAGKTTEKIMDRIQSKLGPLPVDQYNRIYESVIEQLVLEFPESSDVLRHAGGGGMMINRRNK